MRSKGVAQGRQQAQVAGRYGGGTAAVAEGREWQQRQRGRRNNGEGVYGTHCTARGQQGRQGSMGKGKGGVGEGKGRVVAAVLGQGQVMKAKKKGYLHGVGMLK